MIELFESRNEHLYHVRYISQFNTPSVNTVYHGSKSISFLGPKILNLLPNERKNIGSLKILKNKNKIGSLKTVLLEFVRFVSKMLVSLENIFRIISIQSAKISCVFNLLFIGLI